jgi:hypothetical protein
MNWNEILGAVLQAVLIAVIPTLAAAAFKWLWAKASTVWAELSERYPTVTDLLRDAARVAVQAAEQQGAAGLITDKKKYALEIAEKWLAEHGVVLDLDLVSAAIEAAVFDELNRYKEG